MGNTSVGCPCSIAHVASQFFLHKMPTQRSTSIFLHKQTAGQRHFKETAVDGGKMSVPSRLDSVSKWVWVKAG